MEVSAFYSLITGQRPISPEDSTHLAEMAKKYPYFHAVHMLRAVELYTRVEEYGEGVSTVRAQTGRLPRPMAVLDYVQGFHYAETVVRDLEPAPDPADDSVAPLPEACGKGEETPAFSQEVEEPIASQVEVSDASEETEDSPAPEVPIELDIAPFPIRRVEPVGSKSEQPPADQTIDLSKVLDLSLATPITKYTPTGFAFESKDAAALADKNWVDVQGDLPIEFRAPSSTPKTQAELMDAFIESYRELQKQAVEEAARMEANHIEAVDLNASSSVLHSQIASEPLAKIYAEQGNKEVALEMYRVLMEKNPEKSAYFAAIIEKLISADADA